MTKYHLMTACIIIFAKFAFASTPPGLKAVRVSDLPHRQKVQEYLNRSQLPAHLKDVVQTVLMKGEYLDAGLDFNFPGKEQPVDWHIDPKTRRVYSHIDLATGVMTFYPGFLSLSEKEQINLIVHMGLHHLQGLGLSRVSEPAVRELSTILERDQSVVGFEERRRSRQELRNFLDRRWAVNKQGSVLMAPADKDVLKPWPFKDGNWEPPGGN